MLCLLAGLSACQRPGSATENPTEAPASVTETAATEPSSAAEASSADAAATSSVPTAETDAPTFRDYAAELTLDMNTATLKQEVTVKTFVDGDTTHFHVPAEVAADGILKARYLAINTPESTGKIEEYGKTAALFTRERLEKAAAILVESDDGKWNTDSTGERMLLWVWYKPAETAPWRNLNLEILQNGLAIANSTAQNRYGSICMEALEQARRQKLGLYSGQKDPNYYYGEASELTLREIRLHPETYEGQKVAFEASVTRNSNGMAYVEEYDPELDLYLGMGIYLGHDLSGDGLVIMSTGNRVRIVGTLQYYEAGESWQISGLSYRAMRPEDPNNIQKLGEGYTAAYPLTEAERFAQGRVTVPGEDQAYDYAWLTLDSTLAMEGLVIKEALFENGKLQSSGYESATLLCEAGGTGVQLRLSQKEMGEGFASLAEQLKEGQILNIKGVVSSYQGEYQIKILSVNDIEIIHP